MDGEPNEGDVAAFREGVVLADGTKCLPAALISEPEGNCLVEVYEGKYHQVKRMLASRGLRVLALRRLSIGALKMDETLGEGGFRELIPEELKLFGNLHIDK